MIELLLLVLIFSFAIAPYEVTIVALPYTAHNNARQ